MNAPSTRAGAYGLRESEQRVSRLAKLLLPGLLLVSVYYAVFGGEYSVFELHGTRVALEQERAALRERVTDNFQNLLLAAVLLVVLMPLARVVRDYASDWIMTPVPMWGW